RRIQRGPAQHHRQAGPGALAMTNPMSLDGRAIIVTGAGQGIGKAVAELCVELGARVALVDVKADEVAAVADSLGKDRALALAGSVADPGFVQPMVERA